MGPGRTDPREHPVTIARVEADAEHVAAGEVAANLLEPGPSKWFADQPTGDLVLLLGGADTVTSYELVSGDDAPDRDPGEWQLLTLEGSGWSVPFRPEQWRLVDSRSGEHFDGRNTARHFVVAQPGEAGRVYRLRITGNAGSGHLQLSGLRLFGLDAPHPDTVNGFREPAGGPRLFMRGYAATQPARHLVPTDPAGGRWELERAEWESPDPAAPVGPVTMDEWAVLLDRFSRLGPVELGPPATEEQILTLEERLGTQLPPSYRNFLKVSNGIAQGGTFCPPVLPFGSVGWFRDIHQDIHIDNINVSTDLDDWTRVFGRSLAVTPRDDGWYWFLDPFTVDERGEWRAFRWRDGDALPPEAVADFEVLLAICQALADARSATAGGCPSPAGRCG